jgi:hypothetical protein
MWPAVRVVCVVFGSNQSIDKTHCDNQTVFCDSSSLCLFKKGSFLLNFISILFVFGKITGQALATTNSEQATTNNQLRSARNMSVKFGCVSHNKRDAASRRHRATYGSQRERFRKVSKGEASSADRRTSTLGWLLGCLAAVTAGH